MAAEQFSLTIQRATESCQLKFLLDPAFFSQRIMLDTMKANQLYESETTGLLHMLLQPGDAFVDIGGHVGYFSLLASAFVGPSGRIFTFEPDRENYLHLLSHIRLNDLHNMLPFNWAVGSVTGQVEFFFNADNDGGHALWDPGRHPFNQQSRTRVTKVPVFQIRLDDLFGRVSTRVKLMKIDTEGNEVHVLRGAREFLVKSQVAAVIAEVNHFGLAQLGSSEAEMRALMSELGYTTYALVGPLPVRLAPEQAIQSESVFNLLFANPQLQSVVADKWPQKAG